MEITIFEPIGYWAPTGRIQWPNFFRAEWSIPLKWIGTTDKYLHNNSQIFDLLQATAQLSAPNWSRPVVFPEGRVPLAASSRKVRYGQDCTGPISAARLWKQVLGTLTWRGTSLTFSILSFSQQGQDLFLDKVIFKSSVREGFFIEAGADDLLKDSNTLFFELERNWTGILVEPVLWEKRLNGGYWNLIM